MSSRASRGHAWVALSQAAAVAQAGVEGKHTLLEGQGETQQARPMSAHSQMLHHKSLGDEGMGG